MAEILNTDTQYQIGSFVVILDGITKELKVITCVNNNENIAIKPLANNSVLIKAII